MMQLNEYRKINSSFKRICVYRIGNEAGFFSEINNMLMAMVFCLENKLQFRIYSANSNFGNDIWKDYLSPFTKHSNSKNHYLFNERPYIHKRPYPIEIGDLFSAKKELSTCFLTQDIWPYIRNKDKYNVNYLVDTPYIKGNLTLVMSILIKCIWRYNYSTNRKIKDLIDNIKIPKRYAAIFIRRGDKHIEAPNEDLEKYFRKIDFLTGSQNYPLFISSDDYEAILEVKLNYPNRRICNFDFVDDNGYNMGNFLRNYNVEEQKRKIIQLLAQVEIMKNADYFVGTYSTNVGVFVGMARNCENTYDVNDQPWLLW